MPQVMDADRMARALTRIAHEILERHGTRQGTSDLALVGIRTRGVPGSGRVDLHIQIARHLDVVQAHEVTHWVIEAVKRDIADARDVIVHTEPALPGAPYPALPERMQPGTPGGVL